MLFIIIMTLLLSMSGKRAKPDGFIGKLLISLMKASHKPLAKWGLGFVRFGKGWEMLDLDCGDGSTLKILERSGKGGRTYGIDSGKENVERAKALNRKQLGKDIFIRRCPGGIIPFRDESLDLVSAVDSIYFWKNPEKTFLQINRVLKRKGLFVIVLATDRDNPKFGIKWTNFISGMVIRSEKEIGTMLEKAGFTLVETHRKKPSYLTLIAEKTDMNHLPSLH